MGTILAVGAGGFVGAIARYLVNAIGLRLLGPGFPFATLGVNVAGSFALGALIGVGEIHAMTPVVRTGLGVGVLGAFTTFSTFSVDTLALAARGEIGLAALNILSNVALALAAVGAGLVVARSW